MRNAQQRSLVYAQREVRDLDDGTHTPSVMVRAEQLELVIARAFRDGALAESEDKAPSHQPLGAFVKRILAETCPSEDTEYSKGYNQGLRVAARELGGGR